MTFETPLRYPVSKPWIGQGERDAINAALDRNQLSQGQFVEMFEQDFARWVGSKYAVATMNGTVALHLALLAMGVGPGDEVIVPAITFVATANAVAYTGAKVVLADVGGFNWCLHAEDVARKITPQTKVVMPVHLYGHLADISAIETAIDAETEERKQRILVLEDAAEAHGARIRTFYAGTFGHTGVFSFYGNKILSTGEGGMVVTDDYNIAGMCRRLRGQGMMATRRYYHDILGYNYRMTELQGALGIAQVREAHLHVDARREIAGWYMRELKDTDVVWQMSLSGAAPVWWLPTVLLPMEVMRDKVMHLMREEGIETRPTFIPLHQLPMYHASNNDFPMASVVGAQGMSFPSYRGLTLEEVREICDVYKKVVKAC